MSGLIDFPEDGQEVGALNPEETTSENDNGSEDYGDDFFRDLLNPAGESEEVTEDEPTQDAVQEDPPQNDQESEQIEDKPWKNEQNALNAQRRRDTESYRQRIEQETLNKSPEVQLARQLAGLYGTDVGTLLNRATEAQQHRVAQQQGVPVQVVQQQMMQAQQMQALQYQLHQYEFQQWQSRTNTEVEQLKESYPFLTEQDFDGAKDYVFTQLQNTDIPIKQVVHMLYNDKIIEGIRSSERNNALAQASGRMKSPAPSGNAPSGATPTLSAAEKYAAKALGMSEADYLKYK